MDLSFFKTAKFWKEMLMLVVGLLVGAAAVYYFLMPSKLILGSISGLAIVVNVLLEGIGVHLKVSIIILIFNALLLILAYACLGAEVGFKTIVASLLLGPFIDLWEAVLPYTTFLTEPGQVSIMNDPWFDLCAFVLMLGASQAFLFRINASTGGLDIVAMICNKYFHWDMGMAVTVSGAIVCLCAAFIHPLRIVLIGLIGTWMNGIVVDYFTASLNKKKRVCILSKNHEEIRKYIIENLERGCSLYTAKGGYSLQDEVEIQALLTQNEFGKLMEFIRKNDYPAFITAGNCSEVYGRWRGHRK